MDPITIASLASSAIPAIFKLFSGNKQVKEAKQLAASNTFTAYKTPTEITQATELAEREFRNGMPGYDLAKDNIQASTAGALASGIQGASSGGDVLDLASKVNFNQDAALNGLNNDYLGYRNNALGNYTGALKTQAGYKDQEYKTNVLDPYNRKANLAASMYGAGQTNKFGGLDSLSTSALAGATAYSNYKKAGA